jgi:hypothetical protein
VRREEKGREGNGTEGKGGEERTVSGSITPVFWVLTLLRCVNCRDQVPGIKW